MKSSFWLFLRCFDGPVVIFVPNRDPVRIGLSGSSTTVWVTLEGPFAAELGFVQPDLPSATAVRNREQGIGFN